MIAAARQLVVEPASVLHHRARPVRVFDSALRSLIEEMYQRCGDWSGVGLAAPQVGLNLQLAVIAYEGRRFAICNPQVVAQEGEVDADEGCLSLPGHTGLVRRSERVTLRYRNPQGKGRLREFSDWLARIVQHETDHLYGVLCPDRLAPGASFGPAEEETGAPPRARGRRAAKPATAAAGQEL
ncbi:MAG: peptide deformylase [Candidatus Dormibacteria bacterium]